MVRKTGRVSFGLVLLVAVWIVNASAGELDPVVYDLGRGSVLLDDCADCDRVLIEWPMEGTLILRRLPVKILGELYEITDVDFATTGISPAAEEVSDYRVVGSGTLHRTGDDLLEYDLELDVTVNGVPGIQLGSGVAKSEAAWPSFDIRAEEDGTRDPLHIYRLRIVAQPQPAAVPYEVVEAEFPGLQGSYFIDDCLPCGRPTVPVPVGGSFLLRPLSPESDPNPVRSYRVEELDLYGVGDGAKLRILGDGSFTQGGEVALLQSMDLTVSVNDDAGVILASDKVPFPEGVTFPEVDIALAHQNPKSDLQVYSLRLVARPAKVPGSPPFRRGDSNVDGQDDISDAIYTLNWLFLGSEEPSCLEAADTNADGQIDLADAVSLVVFLFQGGAAPPDPGPDSCASVVPEPVLGCATYDAPCAP